MNFQNIKFELERDGVALIPSLVSDDLLGGVRDSVFFAKQNPSPFARTVDNGSGLFFHDFWTYRRNVPLRKFLANKRLAEVLGRLFNLDELRFFHDHILIKESNSAATPWHQDRPYYLVDGPDNFSLWITPDSISEDHSLAFICGSHRTGFEFLPVSFDNRKSMGYYEGLLDLTDDAIASLAENGIKIFRMKPGDAIIFNNKTLHRSLTSSAANSRAALSLRFVTANSWLTKKFVNASPPFHKMGLTFAEGDRLSDRWFPRFQSFSDFDK